MTRQEIAAQKNKAFVLLAVGVAALVASYAIGYLGPRSSVSVLTAILLTAIFLGCMFAAAMIALKLNKEGAAK
jgi:predicted MFS family arabinose efflux permease